MCGICGEIRFDGQPANVNRVARMVEKLAPRGPDASGQFSQNNVALGHRRLKVIDLSDASQQPMVDPHLGLALVFNGIIYNYAELREELETIGYRFFSRGDSEVIIKAYHAWGERFAERLQGMFAIALWERKSGRMILARDRLGIKPLYLNSGKNLLRFASSLPALLEGGGVDTAIDPIALHHYMTLHAVVPAPFTLLKGVRKLPPASILVIEPDGKERLTNYWSLEFGMRPQDEELRVEDWKELLLNSLRLAVRRRLVADVPVGVLLSGGLDSSLIVGLLAEAGQTHLNTFSIGFEDVNNEKGNEFSYSDLIARHFNTEHHKIFIQSESVLNEMTDCVQAMSEPMVSHDNIGFYLLSREVSRHMKVVQSGQGADEVFGGYFWYQEMDCNMSPTKAYSRAFFDRTHEEYCQIVHPDLTGDDYSTRLVEMFFQQPDIRNPVDKALKLDTQVMLVDDPVKRVDNMTMAWGLEARVPFLDHELVELAARMPPDLKIKGDGKWILKEVAREIIPSAVIDRPKGYFPVPGLKYIRGEYLSFMRELMESPQARQRGIFNQDYVATLLKNPEEHITPLQGSKLWQVALLEFWLQTHNIK
ncbi:MAG: N-acetylglutaminylglutamine amidotransferase [Candidatus Nitronauta litoralis]|uniref:asparagine synthase (glutamine-hydrolyzing) n=1 Tax=Candidatus Nitronauta litoralis TaxID=2705533 RepID=A0A7T0BWJ2_9BACT|nr:MAG: N-acetylglutaminylglutamine amidotransferase [Candidatus Nitronauta litoralis]